MYVNIGSKAVIDGRVVCGVSWKVYLDGHELPACVEADDVKGEVVCILFDSCPDLHVPDLRLGHQPPVTYRFKGYERKQGRVVLECVDEFGTVLYRTPERKDANGGCET